MGLAAGLVAEAWGGDPGRRLDPRELGVPQQGVGTRPKGSKGRPIRGAACARPRRDFWPPGLPMAPRGLLRPSARGGRRPPSPSPLPPPARPCPPALAASASGRTGSPPGCRSRPRSHPPAPAPGPASEPAPGPPWLSRPRPPPSVVSAAPRRRRRRLPWPSAQTSRRERSRRPPPRAPTLLLELGGEGARPAGG